MNHKIRVNISLICDDIKGKKCLRSYKTDTQIMQDYSKFNLTMEDQIETRSVIKTGGSTDGLLLDCDKICIGLELGSTGIKIVVLRRVGAIIELLKWGIYEFPFQQYRLNARDCKGALDSLMTELKIKQVQTSLSLNNGIFIQYITLPIFSDNEFIANAPDFISPNYLGNGDKDIFHVKPYGITRDRSGAILKDGIAVIMDESYFAETIGCIKSQSIDLRRVESSSMALANLFDEPTGFSFPHCLIDLGSSSVRMTIIQRGKIIYHRILYSIDKYLTKELSEFYQIQESMAERVKKKMVFPGASPEEHCNVKERIFERTEHIFKILVDEIETTFRHFKDETGNNVTKIVLTGGGALISGIDKFLTSQLNIDAEIGNVGKKIKLHESVDEKKFRLYSNRLAPAIGAARNGLLRNEKRTINLIGDDMSREKKKKIRVAAVLLVLLLTGFFVRNDVMMRNREYKNNIVMMDQILGEMENRINSITNSKLNQNGNDQILLSQIFRKIGNEVPASLWLEHVTVEKEQSQATDALVKVTHTPPEQSPRFINYIFKGRSADKNAIKEFLYELEKISEWKSVTLTKIDWVGSGEDGVWEFTMRLVK